MYDRVKMFQYGQYDSIIQYLDNPCEIVNKSTGEIIGYNGRLENLNISVYNSGVSIKGSLAKFMYSDNIVSLSKRTTKEAICKLSDSLNINLAEANLTELEIGSNFLMQHPINRYLDLLKEAPYLNSIRTTLDTLYFRSQGRARGRVGKNNKVLCFYDKIKEVENREGLIPDVYANQNVLRYEIRYNGRIARQLRTSEVTAGLLYSDKLYNHIKKEYVNNYNSIVKTNYMMSNSSNIKTVTDAFNLLFAKLINEKDNQVIDSFINDLKSQDTFEDRKYYTRLKNKLNEVAIITVDKTNQDLAKELDDEIKNIIAY